MGVSELGRKFLVHSQLAYNYFNVIQILEYEKSRGRSSDGRALA